VSGEQPMDRHMDAKGRALVLAAATQHLPVRVSGSETQFNHRPCRL
jgi:hypothetical protein